VAKQNSLVAWTWSCMRPYRGRIVLLAVIVRSASPFADNIAMAAGGRTVMGRPGQNSQGTSWDVITSCDAEVVIVAPCGFRLEGATRLAEDVVRRGLDFGVPLALTLSCMNPRLQEGSDGQVSTIEHCGTCSKCRERRDAFNEAGINDPTRYAVQPIR